MATKQTLLEVSVHVNSNTGIYSIGEMDFGVPFTTQEWLQTEGNRVKLSKWLRWLATSCEKYEAPFSRRRER